jgi:mannose-6-phosphate isomerase
MITKWYPLLFEPILKDRIWGGQKLDSIFGKKIPTKTTGESWEISTVQDNVSIITNGIFVNQTLNQLINEFPVEVLGDSIYKKFGKQFPLLFKFLDAKDDLSIQVHPNDDLASKRHNSFGKTEMWYIMQADLDAKIIVGFQKKSSPTEYLEHLESKTLLNILQQIPVKKGDVFFLETGTIHAIGAGIVLAEIQQTSDITYRVYDWDRIDTNGNQRELHTDLALEAINFDVIKSQKQYETEKNISNKVVNCPFFTTNFINLDGEIIYKENKSERFKVFMCIEGSFNLKTDSDIYYFNKGQTILIPAALHNFKIVGLANILEIYIS